LGSTVVVEEEEEEEEEEDEQQGEGELLWGNQIVCSISHQSSSVLPT